MPKIMLLKSRKEIKRRECLWRRETQLVVAIQGCWCALTISPESQILTTRGPRVFWKESYLYPLVDVDLLVESDVKVAKFGIGHMWTIGGKREIGPSWT